MFRLLILVLNTIYLLISTDLVFAEMWICADPTTKKVVMAVQGDGKKLGISEANNENINPNCILASVDEFNSAQQAFKKIDTNVVSGNRIVDMTQAEKDVVLANIKVQERNSAKVQFDQIYFKALLEVTVSEINILRTNAGLPARTRAQVITAIKNKIDAGDAD